ncbi:hypothetical protein V8C26DRAFT_393972 [Trichoderma gracile]
MHGKDHFSWTKSSLKIQISDRQSEFRSCLEVNNFGALRFQGVLGACEYSKMPVCLPPFAVSRYCFQKSVCLKDMGSRKGEAIITMVTTITIHGRASACAPDLARSWRSFSAENGTDGTDYHLHTPSGSGTRGEEDYITSRRKPKNTIQHGSKVATGAELQPPGFLVLLQQSLNFLLTLRAAPPQKLWFKAAAFRPKRLSPLLDKGEKRTLFHCTLFSCI